HRPLREDEGSQYERDDAVRGLPAPARQRDDKRGEQLEQTADQKEHSHENRQGLGTEERSGDQEHPDDAKQNSGEEVMKEASPMPDHDGLRDFDAASQQQQPSEEQHGGNCRG